MTVYVINHDRISPETMDATETELRVYLAEYAADDPAWNFPVLAQGTRLFADFGAGWEQVGYDPNQEPGWVST